MFRKGIVLTIITVVGLSIFSSTGNFVGGIPFNPQFIDTVDNSKGILSWEEIAFGFSEDPFWNEYRPCYFELDDPQNITWFGSITSSSFCSGGTWTNDGRWIVCEYYTGALWEIDPTNGDMFSIGGGGTGLNGLSYNPVNEKLYGASSYNLYEIDIETGNQTYIGSFKSGPDLMIAIAFDENGVLYGWDIGTDNLWTINIDTGEATLVGPLGINLNYAQEGAFDYETDILYLAAYTLNPNYGAFLYTCDEDTGNCTLVGQFDLGSELGAFAIPYGNDTHPPITLISLTPPNPDGDNGWYVSNVTVTLNATDVDGINATYYRINGGEWQTYESPFVITEDGDDILIEYYSVDTIGNIEEVKSKYLDIDKTPPNVEGFKWVAYREGCTWYVDFIFNITDETSGIDRIEFFINNGHHETIKGSGPEFVFTIEWMEVFMKFYFKFYCYDIAGNVAILKINGSDIKSHPFIDSYQFIFQNRLERFPLMFPIIKYILGMAC